MVVHNGSSWKFILLRWECNIGTSVSCDIEEIGDYLLLIDETELQRVVRICRDEKCIVQILVVHTIGLSIVDDIGHNRRRDRRRRRGNTEVLVVISHGEHVTMSCRISSTPRISVTCTFRTRDSRKSRKHGSRVFRVFRQLPCFPCFFAIAVFCRVFAILLTF